MEVPIISITALLLCFQWINAQTMPSNNEGYCYSTDKERPQVKHFSSKTAYQVVKGMNFDKEVVIPHCKPVKFWMLSRHGTRLPGPSKIKAMQRLDRLRNSILSNYKKDVAGGLCPEDLQLLEDWSFDKNITENKASYLTTQGWDDLKMLGEDYRKAMPELLSKYDKHKFLFRYTNTQRTEGSYKAFVEGLFGPRAYEMVKTDKPPRVDMLLASYNQCPAWVNRVDNQKSSGTEGGKFKKSNEMNEMLQRVSTRLGFKKTLKFKKVKQMWNACRFESAWFIDKPSAWCAAFTLDDILVLEYLDDLGKEYSTGYSTPMNKNIPCDIIQDLLNRLSSDDDPQVVAYFSHSGLIQLFGTAFGMQKDNSLLKSNNYSNSENRKWRTSELDPFAANYAVIKYDCSDDPKDPSPKVGFFSNQHLIDVDGCKGGICKLDDFMENYKKYLSVNCKNVFCTSQVL